MSTAKKTVHRASRISVQRPFVLALGLALAATIAACDQSPTQPTTLTRVNQKLAIEGDTLQCAYGWIVVNNVYVCKDEE